MGVEISAESAPFIARLGSDVRRVVLDAWRRGKLSRSALGPLFWHSVCSGRWSVEASFEDGEHRFLVCEVLERRQEPLALRERRILELVATGAANKAIAFEVGVSTSRVGNQLRELAERLGAGTRVALILRLRHLLELRRPALEVTFSIDDDPRCFAVGVSPRLDPARLPITSSQLAIAELILEGCSNAEIAERRQTSQRTVANQVAALLRQAGFSSRFELVAMLPEARALDS